MNLSILLWLPLATALLGLLTPGRLARFAALLGSLAALALSIALIHDVGAHPHGLLYVTDKTWIASLGIHYALGVDGLSVFLIALTTLLFCAVIVWCARSQWRRERTFYLHLGIAQSAVLGALMSQDVILFVAFFDLMLIPFFFLTGGWGGKRNPDGSADAQTISAVTKLVIYTMVGSLLMLAAAIAAGVLVSEQTGNAIDFRYVALFATPLSHGSQNWIFLFFAAAFLVKMPAFPLHGWMPDGYRAMPLPVLALFSGVLSKVAAYGFVRIALPAFPYAAAHYQDLLLVIALASILYGSAMAFTTTDIRLVLGYSSVAQLGFITLGIFALNSDGAQGAILQSVNHGLVVAPAMLIVALLAARAGGSEDLRDMGGIAFRAPILATVFLIVAFANLAMPGSSNFVGEFLILLGTFHTKIVFSIIAFTGVAMASVYMLRAFIRAVHNRTGPDVESRELSWQDALVLVPLVGVILGLALYPQLAINRGRNAINRSVLPAIRAAHPVSDDVSAGVVKSP